MDKPTQEQIQKFWEWCGAKYYQPPNHYDRFDEPCYWILPNGATTKNIQVDLNSLFKWAVPKAIKKLEDSGKYKSQKSAMKKLFLIWLRYFWSQTMPIEIALFWAIWEVING